jgi:hypothetical protein
MARLLHHPSPSTDDRLSLDRPISLPPISCGPKFRKTGRLVSFSEFIRTSKVQKQSAYDSQWVLMMDCRQTALWPQASFSEGYGRIAGFSIAIPTKS